MRNLILSLAASLAFALPAAAQCSDLTVTGSGEPGTTLDFAVTGAPAGAPTFLLIGSQTGMTSIPLGPLGTLDVGLAMPFIPVPIGSADATGAASLSVDIPSGLTQQVSLFAQAVSVEVSRPTGGGMPTFGLTFCTSDVEGFTIGPAPAPTV